eukprot:TRINITY_DN20931_c0_g1_i1.p1 TRINITY_DN20931_c0_g1~~TRINITY_DN20931_c0_g1_i1.p1  ORF type:complete len:158 (+),score=75.58 TRINITY_DN20931_c0_g1_i1:137-610(+)
MIRRPPRSTQSRSSAASDVYTRQEGDINSRVMSPKPPDHSSNLTSLLIDTNIYSRKVNEINNTPRVNLLYYDDLGDGYVSLKGDVHMCSHQEAVDNYWDGWRPFFPNGSDSPNYGLMKMKPDTIEFVSSLRFKVGACLLYTSPSPRDRTRSRMPSSA